MDGLSVDTVTINLVTLT